MDCTFDGKCHDSRIIGFDYCGEHLKTPRGMSHVQQRVMSDALFTEDDLENEIARRVELPELDYHTSALEKMDTMLTEILTFNNQAREMLFAINPNDWRFLNRTGEEQTRMEVGLYERAQERAARTLKDVSKMALADKMVSLGRAQVEMMIRMLMNTLSDMNLESYQFDLAKRYLLQYIQEEANLSPRVEHQIENELTTGTVING